MSLLPLILIVTAAQAWCRDTTLPNEVAKFISTSRECCHFEGEEPYDKERAEFLRKALEKLGCNRLHKSEMALRKHYEKQPEQIERIRKASACEN